MEQRLQRRVQRYGWDLAAASYEALWQAQLAGVQAELLASAALAPGGQVLDVACGTGLVTFCAASWSFQRSGAAACSSRSATSARSFGRSSTLSMLPSVV